MRKNILFNILLIAASFFLPNTIVAQYGNVGINTSNPKALLDVEGKKDMAGTVLTNDVTGFQAPRLSLQELNGKGASVYGANQNGTIIYITEISGGTSAGQTINITKPGFYNFNAANNVWQTSAIPQELTLPEWQFYTSYDYTATSAQNVPASGYNATTMQLSAEDLTEFSHNVIIPAGKQAKIIINYSMPVGIPNPQQTGFMGVRMIKNGNEFVPGTRFVTIPMVAEPAAALSWSLENINNTVVDIIPAAATAQTINYKLQSLLGNSSNAARYKMFQTDVNNADDQDWGRATWYFSIYLK